MADLPSFVTSALEPARAALAAGLCLAACVRAFDVLAGRAAALSRARCAGAGVLIGASAWAGAIVGPGLPAAARIDALGAAASLTIAVAGAALALAVFRRCKGALRVIGGGALLGASVAASRATQNPCPPACRCTSGRSVPGSIVTVNSGEGANTAIRPAG